MRYLLTNEQMRKADEFAMQNTTALLLMERAGKALAEKIRRLTVKGNVLCVCGGGNNGGTGYEQQMPTNEQLKRAVEEINKKANNSTAVFGVHEETNRITIKIINKESKEVIKEFPPEKTLDMIAKVWEMAGLMVDEKR